MPRKNTRAGRKGTALIYLTVTMVGLLGFSSLAVDLGHVQLAKTQLRRAADAAALYGAIGARSGNGVAFAQAAAADNLVDGTPLALLSSDVTVGTMFMGGTFTPGGISPNAIRVSAVRSAARQSAVTLSFAQILGQGTCDLSASAVVRWDYVPAGGFVGYNGVAAKNNAFVGSYNSALNTNPTERTASANGWLGSNGSIVGMNNNSVDGNAILGPGGSISGFAVTGLTTTQTAPIPYPSMPAWEPGTNPNNLPLSYTSSSDVTLPGGVYWFSSLTVNGNVYFSGPATVIVNGDIAVGGNLYAANSIPSNLKIYQLGAHNFGDGASNGLDMIGEIYAPLSNLVAKNNLEIRGRGYFGTIDLTTCKNNTSFFYDENYGSNAIGSTNTSTLVQ